VIAGRKQGFPSIVSRQTTGSVNPLTAGLGPNSASFNPWVEISPEKITLIAQHADIGQASAPCSRS
jgi:isoquinoline 1-oxidoreductase subunit beta